ncbi:hypothetical protein GCM10023195_39420 [Actinoallomurus liliacearum]|uniref:DUF2690 domain-containing protein n=1 Tax=Actinoallomurus liliacearum TaxID=1080073 RepID=A0ABP8TN22_9ACTN
MKSTFTRRTTGLLAATAIAGGAAMTTTLGASAQARDTATAIGSSSDRAACTEAHGKLQPRLAASYKITGGDEDVHGVPGGTLQVLVSDRCRTIWVKTVKLKKYATRPETTVAKISFIDAPHHRLTKRVEKTTRNSVETPAAHNPSTRSGVFHVEGGFVGPYQFDSVHTYRY